MSFATAVASQNGWTIVRQYMDNGISGATREKRAELLQLLQNAKKKKFDAVIAKSASRLGRDTIKNLLTAIYGAANSKATEQQSRYMKELASVTIRLNKLNKEFQTLLQLYTEKHIDLERFKAQNEYIQVMLNLL
ncbi:recombinase family protein [Paenibacillus alvei]|nr:recombinase family protein [Paenibacillus alvei]